MINKIFAIAEHTVIEEMRRKTVLILLAFAPICIYTSTIFTSLTPGYEKAFVIDIALSSISFFTMLICAFIASDLFIKEELQGTHYIFLSNPISMGVLTFGKFLGGLIFLMAGALLMGGFSVLLFYIKFHEFNINLVKAVLLLFGELAILLSIGTLGATFCSKFTNFLIVILSYITGHLSDCLEYLKEHLEESSTLKALQWVFKIIPDLGRFEARDLIIVQEKIAWTKILNDYLYAGIFVSVFLVISSVYLKRKYIQ